jgi:hypothetical protein
MQPCEIPYTLRPQNMMLHPQNVFVSAACDTKLQITEFYKRAATMTSAGKYAAMLSRLPNNVAALVRIVHGLLLPEHAAALYGVTLSDERQREAHVRPVERMLDRLLSHDAQPLSISRRPEHRFVGTSRHFVLLLLAMLRAKGIPARARCGFASFLDPGRFEDHWVCEYWDAAQTRWVRVDVQTDAVQQNIFGIDSDLLDVPLHRFVTGGEAWTLCRTGEAHPSQFGISELSLSGLWLIAGNVVRDVAALNKLRELYEADHRVRAPAVVFNSIRKRTEAVEEFIKPVFWDDPLPASARS